MNFVFKVLIVLVTLLNLSITASAANTFTTVYNILQANCASAGCHSATNYNSFSVAGSETDVYNAIINKNSVNTYAAEKGYKLIDPGHPYNSFLLKKIGSEFDSYLSMHQDEGATMPNNLPALQDHEIELVRQWILKGAQQTGNVVDYPLLQDYYANGGIQFIPVPDAPNPSEGMQVRYGPIFIAPGDEVEWDKKESLRNPNLIKVYRTDGFMSWQSHHMLLFKFDDGGAGTREGMRLVPDEAFPFNGGVTLTGAWQNDDDYELPNGTAFFWQPNTVLDFDYHIKNYSQTEILPSDFYLNIYWDNQGERDIEMHAQLDNNIALFLPQGQQTRVSTSSFNEDRYIYMMWSHAHQWGTDFDIYERNTDGSRGLQVYEGFYNVEYTFNQGFYDWEEPPVRYFDPLQKASNGLIYEAKFDVGVPLVTFGLTADDEMMLLTYLYTTEELPVATGINEQEAISGMSIYPNPFNSSTKIDFILSESAEVEIEISNVLGTRLATLNLETLAAGKQYKYLSAGLFNNNTGVYFVTLKINGVVASINKMTKL